MDTFSSSSNDDPSLENRLRRPLEGVVVEKDTDECDDDRDDTDEKEGEEFGEDGMWVFLRFILNKRAFKSLDLGCFFVICLEQLWEQQEGGGERGGSEEEDSEKDGCFGVPGCDSHKNGTEPETPPQQTLNEGVLTFEVISFD